MMDTTDTEARLARLERLLEGLASERNALADTIARLEARSAEAAPAAGRRKAAPSEAANSVGELVELIRSAPAVRSALTEALQPDRAHELELARLEVERHKIEQYVSVALVVAPSLLAAIAGKPELAAAMQGSIDQLRASQAEAAATATELATPPEAETE